MPAASVDGVSQSIAPPPPPPKLVKHKIEYTPIRRQIQSFGGWDLDAVDRELQPILRGTGTMPRTVRELGKLRCLKLTECFCSQNSPPQAKSTCLL